MQSDNYPGFLLRSSGKRALCQTGRILHVNSSKWCLIMKNQKMLFELFKNQTGKKIYVPKPEQPVQQYFPAKTTEYAFKG